MTHFSQALTPIFDIDSIRALDADSFQGDSGFIYMTRAGMALSHQVQNVLRYGSLLDPLPVIPAKRRHLPLRWNKKPVLIFAGKGNNGGDGLVLARHLLREHIPYRLILLTDPTALKGDSARAWNLYQESGGEVWSIPEKSAFIQLDAEEYGLVIDAIFGHGQHFPIEGLYAETIQWIQNSQLPLFCVDSPSGDLHADWTVVLGFARTECFFVPTASQFGQWVVAPLGYSSDLVAQHSLTHIYGVTRNLLLAETPKRNQWITKRGQGVATIIAGSKGMTGAAVLCAQAAMRSGTGLTYLSTSTDEHAIIASQLQEIVFCDRGSELQKTLTYSQAACIGPGLSQSPEAKQLVLDCLKQVDKTWIIDADALNALQNNLEVLLQLKKTPILTPHEGEWTRLFGAPPPEGLERIQAVREQAKKWNCVILLKGPTTVVGDPQGRIWLHNAPNSGLAKAGSGDVLAGILCAWCAQGFDPWSAALIAVVVHSSAGFRCAQEIGQRSMLASDLIQSLSQVYKDFE